MSLKPSKPRVKTRYFKKFFKTIIIPFDEILNKPEYQEHQEFILSLSSKKAYSKIAETIIAENNMVLAMDEQVSEIFIYTYYCLKKKLDCGEYKGDHKEFIYDMITNLFNSNMVDIVKKYVLKRKSYSIYENIDLENHKYDLGTTFIDIHYEILYCISVMSRLVIPLITHYIHIRSLGKGSDEFIMACFMELFNLMSTYYEGENVYNKLYTFIERNVKKNKTNDRVIWNDIKLFGQNEEYAVEDVVTKLMTNTIPKFEFDRNIINLVKVVISNSINTYMLRGKHPYNIVPLTDFEDSGDSNDNVVNQAELVNSYLNKRNEFVIFNRDHFAQDTIDIIKQRNGITIDPFAIDFYTRTIITHSFQEHAIISAFGPYFSGSENIFGSCNERHYAELLAILVEMFKKLGIQNMVKYITGINTEYSMKRMTKTYDNIINNDPRRLSILNEKFKYVADIIKKKDPIRSNIVLITNNSYTYNEYDNPLNGQKVVNDPEEIIDGVLSFYQKIVL